MRESDLHMVGSFSLVWQQIMAYLNLVEAIPRANGVHEINTT